MGVPVAVCSKTELMHFGITEDMENDSIDTKSLISRESDCIDLGNEATKKKRFIFRLVSSLHSAGNLSFRTEAYISQIAAIYNLQCSCAVFPVSAIISFQESEQLNPQSCESYNIKVSGGFDCSKLARLDKLCFEIQQSRLQFNDADKTLTEIEHAGL